ncbi:MAG: VCBS repeat-containing protein [Bacteroidota bacterium]
MKHLLLTASLSAMCVLFSLSANSQQLTSFYLQGQNLRSAELVISHDLDNDGNPDIIAGNRSRIEPYKNLGNGQFERFESGPLSLNNIFISNARSSYPGFTDFDADGDEDVIVSSLFSISGSSLLETEFFYYENTGDGYVEQTTPFFSLNFNFFSGAHTFDLYDFDEDGDEDMIVANEMGDVFLLESRDGAFVLPAVNPFEDINPVGSDPRLVNVQVLVLDDGDSHSIILLNRNNRTLNRYDRTISGYELIDEASNVYAQLEGIFTQLVLEDLDEDGLRDAWGYTSVSIESGQSLFMKRTEDSFDPFSTTKNPFNGWPTDGAEIALVTSDIELADLNNNGQPELYALGRSGTPDFGKILKFDESGTRDDVTNPFASLSSSFISLELIDWDKDGDLDLFAGAGGSPSTVEYYRNDAGTFVQLTGVANPADGIIVDFSPHVCVADFNGDDELDLVLGYTINNDVSTDPGLLYFENESGELVSKSGIENPFAEATVGNLGGNMNYKPEAGDLNGDGKVDIIIGVPKSNGASGEVSFLLNNGNDTYQLFRTNDGPIASMEWPNGRLSASLYDIDQDGDLDIFGSTRTGNILMVENEHSSYFVSLDDILLTNNNFFDPVDFGELTGTGSIVKDFIVKSEKPDFEIISSEIVNLALQESNFKILSTSQTEPDGDYVISVEFNPVQIGTGLNDRLEITTNQSGDEEVFTVPIQGTANGSAAYLYKSLGFGSVQPIQNGRFAFESSRVNSGDTYTLDLMLANTGTEDLIIDVNSLELPEGVTLATATPLQGTVPVTDPFRREGIPLSFQVQVGDEEPLFTGEIIFESNDPFQSPFTFQILITDIGGVSSPGTVFVENILMETDADPKEINAIISRPTTVSSSFELLEGDDIIMLSGSTVTPTGVVGQARLQAKFPGDPANELLPDSSIFFVNVAENVSEEIRQVIEFEDFVMQLDDAPRTLPSFTNATGFSINGGGISFEILSGESVIDIDPTLKVTPRTFGSAEVEVTYQASAPSTGAVLFGSATMTVAVLDTGPVKGAEA